MLSQGHLKRRHLEFCPVIVSHRHPCWQTLETQKIGSQTTGLFELQETPPGRSQAHLGFLAVIVTTLALHCPPQHLRRLNLFLLYVEW